MIITQTPLRVSFLGGGTDYPEYFRTHGGATLGASIDKYTYITVSPLTDFFEHRIRVSYSRTELVREIDEIQHPSVRECLRYTGVTGGVEIAVINDLPARTGLGSSSSFTVGLLQALHAHKGQVIGQEQLAAEAVHVERDLIHERVGVQDQYTCALGGLLHLELGRGDHILPTPIAIGRERLEALQQRLLIFYTGLQRTAHEILEQQIQRTTSGQVTGQLDELRALVAEGVQTLCNHRDLSAFGELLHHGWLLKKQLSDVISNATIDDAYARARQAGAIGGKLLGAGGGGFLLLYAEPYNQAAIRRALAEMREVRFNFENHGSRLIFYRSH